MVELRAGTGTVQRLSLQDDDMFPYNFSFVPPVSGEAGGRWRGAPGCHQLGDLTLRVRTLADTQGSHGDEGEAEDEAAQWSMFSSACAGPTVKVCASAECGWDGRGVRAYRGVCRRAESLI